MEDEDLREAIKSRISIWALNGSEFPSDLADEIMELIENEEADDRHSAVIDHEREVYGK